MSINREEWFKALTDAQASPPEQDPDALTIQELAKVLGCAESTARVQARKLIESGQALLVTKVYKRRDGSWLKAAAYKLIKKEPE